MPSCHELTEYLKSPAALTRLHQLYGEDTGAAQARIERAIRRYQSLFDRSDSYEITVFSSPGRTEIGGNHTDHQHGRVLAASVNLDMLAIAAPSDMGSVVVHSEGFSPIHLDLDGDLSPQKAEAGRPEALIRGIAAAIKERGFPVRGFEAYVTSDVLTGSGLSSSAAFEVLIGTIFNTFYCDGAFSPEELAKIGRYAENVFFQKPCGLMDQIACAVGGTVAIDFCDITAPIVTKVDYDFTQSGHVLCIIDSGADHADLTDAYAAIPAEMSAVAEALGCCFLREVDEAQFLQELPRLRQLVGDRAVLRSMHFFADNRRVSAQVEALFANDFGRFLELVNESGKSSGLYLQNLTEGTDPKRQEVLLTICRAESLLSGRGAVRVHGGGFAGTIQAFVPIDMIDAFKAGMEALLGDACCHIVHIRPEGGCVLFGE